MNSLTLQSRFLRALAALLIGCTMLSASALAADVKVSLSGKEEVPPATTSASGAGTIKIADDKSVSGSVTTTGITGTAAHIHVAAEGKNGPPIITLKKASASEWSVPAGSMLTDEQYASYKAGNLYINVHSAANPGGEIRAQLKP